MSYRTEFPDFPPQDIPAEVIALVAAGALKDVSWRNDGAPQFMRWEDCGAYIDSSSRALVIWEADPVVRDRQWGTGDTPRFEVILCDGAGTRVWQGDDITAALAALQP